VFESIVNVTMPSTSAGVSPESSNASRNRLGSQPKLLRPEFFEKSVASDDDDRAFPAFTPPSGHIRGSVWRSDDVDRQDCCCQRTFNVINPLDPRSLHP